MLCTVSTVHMTDVGVPMHGNDGLPADTNLGSGQESGSGGRGRGGGERKPECNNQIWGGCIH